MVDNNAAEALNSWILELRFLPIIRLFDGIQMKMYKKWGESEKLASKWKADYSPKCMELFEANRYLAMVCQVAFNGSEGYEIREGRNVHTVNLRTERCSCRAWDLTGIPCQHAICAMLDARVEPSASISIYYHIDTYLASYDNKFQPVRGVKFWDKPSDDSPLLPPPVVTQPGRPKEKRVRTEEINRRVSKGCCNSKII